MFIVKKTVDCILKPLSYIFNLSFISGVFPQKMKTAKIIPIFKNGDKHMFNNYRPISILSQFSKNIEKWFTIKLDSFLEEKNILFDYQYGFRSNRSTSAALIHFTEEVLAAIDHSQYMVSVFLDLKKAFDSVNHELLSKLQDYGIRGHVFKWLESYLQNRQQYVQFDQLNSKHETVVCGIPQGSIIGPKLFILFINDIYEATKRMGFLLFADDTTVYKSGSDLDTLLSCVSTEMANLKKWFDQNKLLLNWEKNKYMIFGTRKIEGNINITIDNSRIERVTKITFL
uniref:Reverse transcriptase domain-containing protein n=1 Tax=Neogobius melanostomus TaxID=47308 RepID=A0A8C6TYG5_9GOBI